ncbi:MAG: DnaJ domain-containing protein [Nitrospinae bacterium]|nr:DnaJ domain-containing protein [Nitrospinota bacterium]
MKLSECYNILKVTETTEWRKVKKSYRSLAKQFHPDRNPGDPFSEEHFKKISRAFKTLEARQRFQSVWKSRFQGRHAESGDKTSVKTEPDRDPSNSKPSIRNFPELLNLMSPAVRERFVKSMEKVGKMMDRYEKFFFPLDMYITVNVDSPGAIESGKIKVRTANEDFEVNVPFGSWNSMLLRVPEKGNYGFFNKKRGDLLLNIQILPGDKANPANKKRSYKIQAPRQSIEEGKVMTLQTHEGPIKFFLPRNTADGQTFILRTRPRMGTSSPTNHVVTVRLV